MLTHQDIMELARLLVAAGVGMVIGINRDLHGKPTGMRTLGLVSMGAALVALSALRFPGLEGQPDAQSRVLQGVIQGVMTGIGFLGAGVVLRNPSGMEVHGLTTAATVWVTAALGIACAVAPWHLVVAGLGVTLGLLALVRPVEKLIETRAHRHHRHEGGEGGEETPGG